MQVKLMQHFSVHYNVVKCIEDLQKTFYIRDVVFIEEQNIPYTAEFDEFDYSSIHFLATIENEPVGAARLRLFKDYVKIERLAIRKAYRGKSIGKGLFSFVLDYIAKMGYSKITLHAQSYLLKFYENFGFVIKGEKNFEAGIEHYYMEKCITIE